MNHPHRGGEGRKTATHLTCVEEHGSLRREFLSRGVKGRNPAYSGNELPPPLRPGVQSAVGEQSGRSVSE